MRPLTIYKPPMCCSTGISGTDVDSDLVNSAAMNAQLGQRGIQFGRHNLAQEPLAFVQNPKVKALLDTNGSEALPLISWDEELKFKGRSTRSASDCRRPEGSYYGGGFSEGKCC